jgi:hypothetical protein
MTPGERILKVALAAMIILVATTSTWGQPLPSALSPLATPEESTAFEKTYGTIISEARTGTAPDRKAVADLLTGKLAEPRTSAGTKRLLALRVFDLLKADPGQPSELQTAARQALNLLDDKSIASVRARVEVMTAARVAGLNGIESDLEEITKDCVRMAALQYSVGQSAEALATIDIAETWAKKDVKLAAIIVPQIDAFRTTIRESVASDKILATRPDDPLANTRRAMELLTGPQPDSAGPYLIRSGQPEFRRLGIALTSVPQGSVKRSIEVATAALDCLPLVSERPRGALQKLIAATARDIRKSQDATDADKARADLLEIKLRQMTAKLGADVSPITTTQTAATSSNITVGEAADAVLFGLTAEKAERVVFVLDHSGSMIDTFDFLRAEAKKQVNKFTPTQKFSVILFSEEVDAIFPKNATAPTFATPTVKKEFATFIDSIRAAGINDDLYDPFAKAMVKAFALQPQVIYLLTDGNFDPGLVGAVKKLNATGKVRVYTIAFIKVSKEAEEALQKIAADNGGKFKYVQEKDLGK